MLFADIRFVDNLFFKIYIFCMEKVLSIAEKIKIKRSVQFIAYLWSYWYVWLTLFVLFGLTMLSLSYLIKINYFSSSLVRAGVETVEIVNITSNNGLIVITNPLIKSGFYEVNLGFKCNLNYNLINQQIQTKYELYKRNYNNSYYLSFPDIKKLVCL